jgi:hypothetical protein
MVEGTERENSLDGGTVRGGAGPVDGAPPASGCDRVTTEGTGDEQTRARTDRSVKTLATIYEDLVAIETALLAGRRSSLARAVKEVLADLAWHIYGRPEPKPRSQTPYSLGAFRDEPLNTDVDLSE